MSTFVYCLLVALGLVIALLAVRVLFVASGIHYWARIGSVKAISDLLAKDPDLVNSADTGGETRHRGKFANKREIRLQEIEDWQVGLPDGTFRGSFGFLVVFHRTLEQTGRLPKEFFEMKDRFIDHDLASLLEATGE